MRTWIDLLESSSNPAEQLHTWSKSNIPEGINFEAHVADDETLGIQWIERTTAAPGTAQEFLTQLCLRADDLGCYLSLGVQEEFDEDDPRGDRDHEELIRYYMRLGFEESGYDGEFVMMSREPQD